MPTAITNALSTESVPLLEDQTSETPATDWRTELLRCARLGTLTGAVELSQKFGVKPLSTLLDLNRQEMNVLAMVGPFTLGFLLYMLVKNTQLMQRIYNRLEKESEFYVTGMEVKRLREKLAESLVTTVFFLGFNLPVGYIAYHIDKTGPSKKQAEWLGIWVPTIVTLIFTVGTVSGTIPAIENRLKGNSASQMIKSDGSTTKPDNPPSACDRLIDMSPALIATLVFILHNVYAGYLSTHEHLDKEDYPLYEMGISALTYLVLSTGIRLQSQWSHVNTLIKSTSPAQLSDRELIKKQCLGKIALWRRGDKNTANDDGQYESFPIVSGDA